jgi:hypothetical protein
MPVVKNHSSTLKNREDALVDLQTLGLRLGAKVNRIRQPVWAGRKNYEKQYGLNRVSVWFMCDCV